MSEQFTFGIDLSLAVVRCNIPGEPHAWERAGRNGKRTFDTKANIEAKKLVRQYLWISNPDLTRNPVDKLSRFGCILLFATKLFNTDADNYAKNVLDACKGIVWHDDRQLDELYVRVVRGVDKPRAEITFYKLTDPLIGGK